MLRKSYCFSILFLIVFSFSHSSCTSEDKKEAPGKINNFSIITEGAVKKDAKDIPAEKNNSLIILEGILKEVIVSARTLSEYRYYIINTSNMEKIILFNDKSFSAGFNSYINKKVIVKGVSSTGFIGWRKIQRDGIKVQEIQKIK